MGFYGNITNTARTQFQFDRIYQNRAYMERAMHGDGVYIGRYVLIEYDSDTIDKVEYKKVYRESDYHDTHYLYYTDDDNSDDLMRIRFANNQTVYDNRGWPILTQGIGIGTIVYVEEDNLFTTFYECTSSNEGYAVFDPVSTDSSYAFNYSVDKAWAIEKGYNNIGRGWDSTVWQKTYQNGVEKYVMIAELNTVVPTFGISPDAPSISPIAPHFGANSTNVYYNVHWQPNWAFRIKAADGQLSIPQVDTNGAQTENTLLASSNQVSVPTDISVDWTKAEYDKTTDKVTKYRFNWYDNAWHDVATITMDDEAIKDDDNNDIYPYSIPAAIYFNKAGFDPTTISYSADKRIGGKYIGWQYDQNKIIVEPTGYSGHSYNNHDNNLVMNPEPDTQELSIMLPGIGDTIAHVWDLIYGNRDLLKSDTRNLDIAWEDASRGGENKGLRLIHKKDNEYSYETSAVSTLAGCINSVHDILGMIITNEALNEEAIQSANENWIYYNTGDKTYNKKQKVYSYPTTGSVQDYKPISLINFDVNLNYFERRNGNYLKLIEPKEHINYYQLTNLGEPRSFTNTYEPNKYFYIVTDDTDKISYVLDTNLEPTPGREYIDLYTDEEGNAISGPIHHEYYFYEGTGIYYWRSNDEEDIASFTKALDIHLVKGRTYYYRYIQQTSTSQFIQYVAIPQGQIVEYEANKYYIYENGSYTPMEPVNNSDEAHPCYTIPESFHSNIRFYQPNIFFYINQGNYLLDFNNEFTEGRDYYSPTFTLVTDKNFYIPNRYYYINNGEYIIDTANEKTSDRVYYEKQLKYVAEDTAGIFSVGSIWNENITPPASVTLCNREEHWELQPLPGFAKDLNTIHGLILRINNMLAEGDVYTRDKDTVQGSINILHDIIAKFDILNPSDVMITDDYGRIHGATQTTAQAFNYTNIGTASTSTLSAPSEDQWINWTVNASALNPSISITHAAHTVADTTTTANKNIANGNGLNAGVGDSLVLYTPIVDNTGHIVGKNTETVTLPFGFKILKSLAQSEDDNSWTSAAQSTPIDLIAPTTQSTITFATGNKWIRAIADNSTNQLTIAHETHNITTTDLSAINLNTTNNDTLDTYRSTYDIAGHFTGYQKLTYTLPYSFKTFTVSEQSNAITQMSIGLDDLVTPIAENDIIAANTQDTFTFATGNKWIRLATNNSTLTIAHHVGSISVPATASSSLSSISSEMSFTIPVYNYDEAGHIIEKISTTYTLPNSYGKLTINDNNSTLEASVTHDNLTISGTSLIGISTNDNVITFTHLAPTVQQHETVANSSLTFGGTFDITDLYFDTYGHKYDTSVHTLTLPSITIANTIINNVEQIKTSANILSDISFNNNNGILSLQRINVGDLLLEGYVRNRIINDIDTYYTGDISSSDSLNIALAKLQNTLINTNTSINSSLETISDDIGDINTTLEGLSILNDEITYENGKKYFLTKTNTGLEWIGLEIWTGGSY